MLLILLPLKYSFTLILANITVQKILRPMPGNIWPEFGIGLYQLIGDCPNSTSTAEAPSQPLLEETVKDPDDLRVPNSKSSTNNSEVNCLAVVQRVTGSSLGPLTGLCKNFMPGCRKGSQSALVKKKRTS